MISESLESSCPWDRVNFVCEGAKKRCLEAAAKRGFDASRIIFSFRVTQIYETGACVYFYYSFNFNYAKQIPYENLVHIAEDVEEEIRDEIIRQGGSLSHHHGVGKLRKRFMPQIVAPAQIEYFKELKKTLDPKNVFAAGNTYHTSQFDKDDDLSGGKHGLSAYNLKGKMTGK